MPKGRKPIPRERQRLRGNPGKRPLDHADDAVFESETPDAPDYLEGEALQIYERHCRILSNARVITAADRDVIARLSWVTAELNEHTKALRSENSIQTSQRGAPTIAARMRLIRDLIATERQLISEVGLSPTARNRLKTVKELVKETDPKAAIALELFTRKRGID